MTSRKKAAEAPLPKITKPAKPRPQETCPPEDPRSEQELFDGLPEDVLKAWQKLRKFMLNLGSDQSPYTSSRSIMFKRGQLYAFVTPRKTAIELYIILPRVIDSELIRNFQSTKTRTCHMLKISHVDQVEEPITDWLREAYDVNA